MAWRRICELDAGSFYVEIDVGSSTIVPPSGDDDGYETDVEVDQVRFLNAGARAVFAEIIVTTNRAIRESVTVPPGTPLTTVRLVGKWSKPQRTGPEITVAYV
jgi:hypothetical protein